MRIKKNKSGILLSRNLLLATIIIIYIFSCSKQDVFKERNAYAKDSSAIQVNYFEKVKSGLKDSLNVADFSSLDLDKVYKSKDVRSGNYFLRLYFNNKAFDDFILLKTDSAGNILLGKIVQVQRGKNQKINANTIVEASSFDRKNIIHLRNTRNNKPASSIEINNQNRTGNVSSLMEEPVGEQTLPDVVITGYIYDDPAPYFWYSFDDIFEMSSGGGGTYTYGSSEPQGGGDGTATYPDETIDITYENANEPSIDITKYIKCFSLVADQGATYKITIYSDIPVNNDPYQLFDFNTGACGHTFLQLEKSNGTTSVQQNIGFYPQSGWKSIEANSPVASKLADNAGHEFNASLTINVNASEFQSALTEIQYYSKSQYDIDNFNCTDFALSVFNAVAPEPLEIPQYHIPGGMNGEFSNTPQGLYNELSNLSKSTGYPYGQILMPGVAGYTGSSHGACN